MVFQLNMNVLLVNQRKIDSGGASDAFIAATIHLFQCKVKHDFLVTVLEPETRDRAFDAVFGESVLDFHQRLGRASMGLDFDQLAVLPQRRPVPWVDDVEKCFRHPALFVVYPDRDLQ